MIVKICMWTPNKGLIDIWRLSCLTANWYTEKLVVPHFGLETLEMYMYYMYLRTKQNCKNMWK